ncbi:energy transducer TonB, partial [Pseudaquabacterium pictum]|uniref:energy transducer TonB n=1 Tax=Pseudaquabacterium pictum TaxID=2315236 RepID=UPI001D155EA6
GLIVVVVGHVVLGYALVNGLGHKIVEVIKAPIETKIIEEVKPPPPPPPENLPPPPKVALPPPSFVPPPEIQVANPPPAPAITVTREAPPPAPVAIAPAPAPGPTAPAAPPAPPAPKRQAVAPVINVATCEKPEFPAAAMRAEATGTTKIRFTVDATGKVSKAEIEKSAGPSREHRLLDRTAIEALSKCPFKPGTDENGQAVGATTVVEYVWKTE